MQISKNLKYIFLLPGVLSLAAVLMLALRHVAQAQGGVAEIARRAKLTREAAYKMLSKSGNPELRSLTAVLAAAGAYVLAIALLPLLALAYASTQPYFRAPSLTGLGEMTLANYRAVLGDGRTLRALGNSVLLAVLAATAVTAVTAVLAWLVVRTRVRGRRLLDMLAFVPLAIPGLVLGVALLAVYVRSPVPVYGTLWLLLIAYCTRFTPYGIRFASASLAQVGHELEESAAACGASFPRRLRRILLPLVAPGLAAGWLTVVVLSLRELSSSILLYSPGNEVLSIRIWNLYESGEFPELAALGVVITVSLTALVAAGYRLGARGGRGTA